jgi:transposase
LVDIILGKERRQWTDAMKRAIVAETIAAGAVSPVARRHGAAPSMVFAWRKQFGAPSCRARPSSPPIAPCDQVGAISDFALVTVTGTPVSSAPASSKEGGIEIEIGPSIRMRISGGVDPALASAVAKALAAS